MTVRRGMQAPRTEDPDCRFRRYAIAERSRCWGWLFLVAAIVQSGALPAPAAEPVPEPDGYRMERFRAPVPATLEGGTVVATEGVQALIADGPIVLIDVLPRPPRPKNLKPGTVWRPRPRHNIPGSVWLPNSGLGALPPAIEAYFQGNIKRLTADDKDRKLLFYCKADCWMSWNAAKRAISYGYSQVYWYPDGTDGWTAAGLPTANAEPVPLPIPGS